jgi:hypothetical protein
MKTKKYFMFFVIALVLCGFLMISLGMVANAASESDIASKPATGELTAIDVPLDSRPILDRLDIRYQDQPRFGYWRAAATNDQLQLLRQEGVSYSMAGNVAIVESGNDQTSQLNGIDTLSCQGSNNGNYAIPVNPTWVYSPIFTNCTGVTTVDYIDVYYDVIHAWADNALYLNVGSNYPSWTYFNLEAMDSCTAPANPNWHKYQYNITAFNGRPVNQRWDLVASDGCSGSGGPTGYIDAWSIWVYYSPPPHTPSPENPYLGPEIRISEDERNDYSPAIAYNSKHNEYLVVWESEGPGGFIDVYAQRITSSGKLLSWFAVGTYPNSKIEPSVAYDRINDRYLVVWAYDVLGNGTNWDLYGRFIPWNGTDPSKIDFMICDWSSNQQYPGVTYAYTQKEFMVVWQNYSSGVPSYISGRRVYADMSGMSADFTISSGTLARADPDITYNLARNEYLVVWDVGPSATEYDIYGLRLRGDGVPLGNEFAIAGWPDHEVLPSVAACDKADQYLVAWQSDHGTSGLDYAIYARYISGDTLPGNVYLIDNTINMEKSPVISCDYSGQKYLLTWKSMYTNGYYGIWARIAYPDETMQESFEVINPGPAQDRDHQAVSGGLSDYLVAWEHVRADGNYDIHGRLLRYALYLPVTLKQ